MTRLIASDSQTSRGGWGYVAAKDGSDFDEGNVTICVLQALVAARKAGIEDLNAKYDKDDMCRSDVIFAATGVTNGSIVRGARRVGPYLETETILMRSRTGSVRRLLYRTRNH